MLRHEIQTAAMTHIYTQENPQTNPAQVGNPFLDHPNYPH